MIELAAIAILSFIVCALAAQNGKVKKENEILNKKNNLIRKAGLVRDRLRTDNEYNNSVRERFSRD